MECREVREYLPAYAEQAGGPRASAVEEHLRTCAGCRTELEQFRELGSELALLSEHRMEPPAWLLGTLTETVGERAARLAAIIERRRRLAQPRTIATGGALLAAGLAGAMVMGVLRRRRRRLLRTRAAEVLAEA